MSSLLEAIRFILIGLIFGLIWAIVQYTNGQMTDFKLLAGPIIVFAIIGLVMWAIRRAIILIRSR